MEFNNREIALLLWAATFIILMTGNSKVRESALEVALAIFRRTIVLSLTFAVIWICVCILVLFQCGLWQWSNFKTTLVWGITFAFVTMFDVERISEDNTFFSKTVRDTIGATAIVAFIAESYSFGLLIELILVPVLVLVSGVKAVAQGKPEYSQAEKLCNAILIIAGLTYVGYGLYMATMNFSEFVSLSNLREFIVPILLSLLFLPFIFIFSIYVTYETNFLRLNWALKDKDLRRYAKLQAIFSFRLNITLLRRWARDITINQPSSRSDIKDSIAQIKKRNIRELNPPMIPSQEGWCPYTAKEFVSSIGLSTGDYHHLGDGQWFANSKMLELENKGIFPDNLAYYVEGDEHAAQQLKLILNVNNPSNSGASENSFLDGCEVLLRAAIGVAAANLRERISRGDDFNEITEDRYIALKKEKFSGGYSKTLVINHSDAHVI